MYHSAQKSVKIYILAPIPYRVSLKVLGPGPWLGPGLRTGLRTGLRPELGPGLGSGLERAPRTSIPVKIQRH